MKRSGMKGGLHFLQSSILFLTEKRGRRSMAREDDICFFSEVIIGKNLGLHWRDWQACADRGDRGNHPNFLRFKYYI